MPHQSERILVIKPLPSGDAVRGWFDLGPDGIIDFVLQLEVYLEERWRPMKRYDCAHGRPHCDILDWDGHTVDWNWTEATDPNEAYIEARSDLVTNDRVHREAFERRKR